MHPCFDWHLLNGFRKTIAGPSRFQTRSWFGSSDYPKGHTLMPCDCRAWRPKCRLMKECPQHEMHELCVWMNCVFDVCLDRCVCESFSVRVAVSTNGFRRRFRRKKSGKKIRRRCGRILCKTRLGPEDSGEGLGKGSGMLWRRARSDSTRFWRMF